MMSVGSLSLPLVFPGALNVKLLDTNGYETVLWTRSGAHSNLWQEAHCPVPHQLTSFHVCCNTS